MMGSGQINPAMVVAVSLGVYLSRIYKCYIHPQAKSKVRYERAIGSWVLAAASEGTCSFAASQLDNCVHKRWRWLDSGAHI